MSKFVNKIKDKTKVSFRKKVSHFNNGNAVAFLNSSIFNKDRAKFCLYLGVMVGITIIMSDSAFASDKKIVNNALGFDGLVKGSLKPVAKTAHTYSPAVIGIGAVANLAFNMGANLGEAVKTALKGAGWGVVGTGLLKIILTPFI